MRLCVDRQDYLINWQSRRIRKNIQFTSICTVEGKTGYVLGRHLNYDPDRNQADIDEATRINGELDLRSRRYFHAHPQYWKTDEFHAVARSRATEIRPCIEEEPTPVEDLIREKELDRMRWPAAEMADYPARGNQLPPDTVMTHLDYASSWQGMVYVAFVIDVFARKIVGWRVCTSMSTGFVLDALRPAPFASVRRLKLTS